MPPRRITALPLLMQRAAASLVTLGRRFVEEEDDAERHAAFLDAQAVGADVSFDGLADRIDLGGDLLDAVGHRFDALVVELQSLDQRGGEIGLLGGGDVFGVGGEQRLAVIAQGLGDIAQGGDFGGAIKRDELARRLSSGLAEGLNIIRQILHRRAILGEAGSWDRADCVMGSGHRFGGGTSAIRRALFYGVADAERSTTLNSTVFFSSSGDTFTPSGISYTTALVLPAPGTRSAAVISSLRFGLGLDCPVLNRIDHFRPTDDGDILHGGAGHDDAVLVVCVDGGVDCHGQ